MQQKALSTTQRKAIRWIADGRWEDVQSATLRSLIGRGLVAADGMALTAAGSRAHERIMASGDGPEDLKALLSFGRGRR